MASRVDPNDPYWAAQFYDAKLLRGAPTSIDVALTELSRVANELQRLVPGLPLLNVHHWATAFLKQALLDQNRIDVELALSRFLTNATNLMGVTNPYTRGYEYEASTRHAEPVVYNNSRNVSFPTLSKRLQLFTGLDKARHGQVLLGTNEYSLTPSTPLGAQNEYGETIYRPREYVRDDMTGGGRIVYHPDNLERSVQNWTNRLRSTGGQREWDLRMEYAKRVYQLLWLIHNATGLDNTRYADELRDDYYSHQISKQTGISEDARAFAQQVRRRRMPFTENLNLPTRRPLARRPQSASGLVEGGGQRYNNIHMRGMLNRVARGRFASDTSEANPIGITSDTTSPAGEAMLEDYKLLAEMMGNRIKARRQAGLPDDPKYIHAYNQLFHDIWRLQIDLSGVSEPNLDRMMNDMVFSGDHPRGPNAMRFIAEQPGRLLSSHYGKITPSTSRPRILSSQTPYSKPYVRHNKRTYLHRRSKSKSKSRQ